MNDKSVVPDTNTVVSALLFSNSVPAVALRHAGQAGDILASDSTLQELEEVLSREKFARYLSTEMRRSLYLGFRDAARLVAIYEEVRECRDPKDDKFLSLAVAGAARTILTGDKDLLNMHPFRGISILNAADYLKLA